MPSNEFEKLLLVNDELVSLSRLGVPFDLGLGSGPEQVEQDLQRINAEVARKMSQGVSLDSYLASLQQTDQWRYASTMRYALATGGWSTVLDRSREVAAAGQRVWWSVWSGMTYPLLICLLAYGGLVAYCLYLVPMLESMYTDLRVPVGTWLGVMLWLRSTMWLWSWMVPMVLVVVVGWLRWRSPARIAKSASLQWNRRAQLADVLGDLAASAVPPQQAIDMAQAACVTDSSDVRRRRKSSQLEERGSDAEALPPLLRWMMNNPGEPKVQGDLLHAAANTYEGLASISSEKLDRRAMLVPCVLIGGGAALLYGLALFLPLVELLMTLATEPFGTPLNS